MKTPLIAAAMTVIASLGGSALAQTQGQDCMGRPVPIGEGRPTLVLYANRDNRAQLHDAALSLAYQMRGERPVVVVHVDLSDVPGLFKGMAKGELQKSQRESVEDMAKLFRAHGEQPPPELATSLYVIGDSDGQPHRALGLQKHFRQPLAQVLDAHGTEITRGLLPESGPALQHALEVQDGGSVAQR